MTDKELRRMGRGDLIEIIYQYQKREQELMEENAALQRRLEDRRINIEKAGSIAEAALYLNHIFESAQAAADHYLEEVRASGSEREAQAGKLMERAREEAEAAKQLQREARQEAEAAKQLQREVRQEAEALSALKREEDGQAAAEKKQRTQRKPGSRQRKYKKRKLR